MSGHYQPDEKKILPHNNLKQAASLMAIAGLMDPQQACDEVVSVGGGKGFPLLRVLYAGNISQSR